MKIINEMKIKTVSLCFIMILLLTACGKEIPETTTNSADPFTEEKHITVDDVNEAFYQAEEEETRKAYADRDKISCALYEQNSDKYVKISIPQEFLDENADFVPDDKGAINTSLLVDGVSFTLSISVVNYDYNSGNYAKNLIYRNHKPNHAMGYTEISAPNGTNGSFKSAYYKDGEMTTNKYMNIGNDVVINITLNTGHKFSSSTESYDIVDAVYVSYIDADEAESINKIAYEISDEIRENAGYLELRNPYIMDGADILSSDAEAVTNMHLFINENGGYIESMGYDRSTVTDISELKYFKNLKKLYIDYIAINVGGPGNLHGWEELTDLANLEVIVLDVRDDDGTDIDIDLSGLSYLPNLKALCLHYSGAPDKIFNIETLEGLQHLEQLKIVSSGLEGINVLSTLPKLTRLNIYANGFIDLNELKSIKNLEDLEIEYFSKNGYSPGYLVSGYSALTEMPNLKILNIENLNERLDISLLNSLENLEKVKIYSSVSVSSVEELNNPNIKYANLSASLFEDPTPSPDCQYFEIEHSFEFSQWLWDEEEYNQ
ncbi:MAG: hypothetical protein HDR03_12475 [Lachnospiraceae bacterium]|nr:hypothetical protein [Lachnospiraceae bacterium]